MNIHIRISESKKACRYLIKLFELIHLILKNFARNCPTISLWVFLYQHWNIKLGQQCLFYLKQILIKYFFLTPFLQWCGYYKNNGKKENPKRIFFFFLFRIKMILFCEKKGSKFCAINITSNESDYSIIPFQSYFEKWFQIKGKFLCEIFFYNIL